ncbi:hypothetical protein HWD99_12200 [Microbacterium sp. C5A9]|nr:hypothetical protein [Microbacterium sp. C5A9]
MAAALRRAGFPLRPIAEVFNVSPRTLGRILERDGLAAPRRKLSLRDHDEMRTLRAEGWTLTSIGARFEISRHRVAQIIRTEET